MTSIVKYTYIGHDIEFDAGNKNVMVNASTMAKVHNKRVEDFFRLEQTQAFIDECLREHNAIYFGLKTRDCLYISIQKKGTWMHRVLAVRFAAWLDPAFDVWIYKTIDQIIFGNYYQLAEELRESALRQQEIQELKDTLLEDPKYTRLQLLENEERRSARRRGIIIRNQLDLFRGDDKPDVIT